MSAVDWSLVVILNGAIIAYGFYLGRNVRTSSEWFLAGRRLPWWLVGMSMYATAIDSSDLIADSGATYNLGFSYFVVNWVGVVFGWALAAFFVFLPMYRAGMYTNAEYLEARYGPAVRVICVFIQVQYRTLVLGIIGMTMFLTVTIVCGWPATQAWCAVGAVAVLAAIYTSFGGLRSVAITDAMQFVVMSVAGLIVWFVVFNWVGGWQGIEDGLTRADQDLPAQLLHAGHDNVATDDVSSLFAEPDTQGQEQRAAGADGQPKVSAEEWLRRKLLIGGEYDAQQQVIRRHTPAWLVSLSFIIMGVAYSIVNHTQSMRMFAVKNEWHLKMTVFAAGLAMLVMSFFNLSMGVMGRALFPDQALLPDGNQDAIYPYLVSQFSQLGLKGIVVAGILAAGLSTYDSIGSSLSALLTRDVYARFIVRDRDDRHYLRAGQLLTPLVIAISFLYIPFMEGGMLMFYLEITSTFVIPLLTLYLMGAFTRVHRTSGLVGLVVGAAYGILRLFAPTLAEQMGVKVMPAFMTETFASYPVSMVLTAGTMVVMSLIRGWEKPGQLLHEEQGPWLRSSQLAARQLAEDALPATAQSAGFRLLPVALAILVVATGCVLSFYVFW